MTDKIKVAKVMFSIDAILGILVVGAACLFSVAYRRHGGMLPTFLTIFVPLTVLWLSICYWAYKGLTSDKVMLKLVFWFYVICNAISFPIGTAIAGVSIWLRRELRKQASGQPCRV
jgi:hypothetical protein